MASLLDGVNDVLKRNSVIDSAGDLQTLSDAPRQIPIDVAIQVWNESIDELYSMSEDPKPNILSENTITLATDDRDYALESDLILLYFPLLDETNGRYISEYPGGYLELINDQPFPDNNTGIPTAGAIRPTDGELYLNYIPTSDENGLVYKYRYLKDSELSAAADVMPFSETVYRALIPAVSELWKLHMKREFTDGLFRRSMGRASRFLSQTPRQTSWTPQKLDLSNSTDPLSDA